jgi:glycosyltransferase involved in cell wall biosynthesis
MNKNILWLPSWYPNKLSPFEGDFIQRHAIAASLFNSITVIFIKKDQKGIVTKSIKQEKNTTGNLTEIIIYYSSFKTGISLLDRLLSKRKYNYLYKEAIKKNIEDKGKPALVHIHVALNIIRQAFWLKKKYQIPLIITEHWSGYLPEAKVNINNYSSLYIKGLNQLFTKANHITVVSAVLGEAIKHRLGINNYTVIPNVVDIDIFFPIVKKSIAITTFIHASSLDDNKNPPAIIEAFSIVKTQGYTFKLIIYGPSSESVKELVNIKKLQNEVTFKNEVPQHLLAKDMQQADALILYSKYETFGCVVIEANACGIPAILSSLPVFKEYIIENKTGIFANPNDCKNLADKIISFIQQKDSFSPSEISNYTKGKFSYQIVGKQFDELYRSLIK